VQGYLLWEEPEGACSILVRRSLLDRLKSFAQEAFSNTRAESGGVLLGRSEALVESGRRVISIENFEAGVSRLHERGVVGLVRFRRQTMLHLNEADFLALRTGLGMVCLMVRPDSDEGVIGGFFYRDGKTVRCPPMGMQFPIDSEAHDCRGWGSPIHVDAGDEPSPSRGRRLVYAAIGLVLMASSFAIWLIGR
jgi:hypothetical protein